MRLCSLRFVASLTVAVVLAGCSGTQVAIFPIKQPGIQQESLLTPEDIKRQEIVSTALSTLGTPYRWGGKELDEGFDCSGLVHFAYTENGVNEADMPRVTTQLASRSRPISREDLKPGDLVFFNTLGRRYSHVGIYIGGGRFVNAPAKGKEVRVDSMDNPYYKRRFTGARRLDVLKTAIAQHERNSEHQAQKAG